MKRLIAFGLASFVLSACAHAGAGFVPVAGGDLSTEAFERSNATTGKVVIAITVPKATLPARARYVSPSTNSMLIEVYNKTHTTLLSKQTANLAKSSSLCKPAYQGRTCTVAFAVPAGSDTFDVVLYDKPAATGNALSVMKAFPHTVVAGKTSTLTMTLGGLARGIAILGTPSGGLSGEDNTAGFSITGSRPQTLTIVPTDADGNYIVGPGAPAISWPVAPSNVTLTAPTKAKPNVWTLASSYQATNPTVAARVTIAVQTIPVAQSGGAVVKKSVRLALYQPWIYVMNAQGTGATAVRAYDENGNQKQLSGTWGGLTNAGTAIYSPSNQRLYVAQNTTSGTITAYDVMGNLQTTSGGFGNLSHPGQPALDTANSQIYVPNFNARASQWVTAYDLNGNQLSVSNNAFLAMSTGAFLMTYDAGADQLYAFNYNAGELVGYDASGNALTSGGFSGVDQAFGMTVDANDGDLYVGNGTSSPGAVTAYNAQGASVATAGGFPGITYTTGIAYDPYADRVYVSKDGSSVLMFDPKGNPLTPTGTNPFANAGSPYGLVIVP